jgi:hypothetical protein
MFTRAGTMSGVLLFVLAAVGCESGQPGTPQDAGLVDASGAGSGGQNTGGKGGSGGQVATCVADVPCFGREARCVGERQLQPYREVSCREVCGDRPCSGSMCRASGAVVDCPEGQVCRETRLGSGVSNGACVDAADGGV